MKTVYIERMSWTDFRAAMEETDTIIIPLGVMEEHGPHAPLGTDTIIAEHCAKLIGEATQTPVAPFSPTAMPPTSSASPALLLWILTPIAS